MRRGLLVAAVSVVLIVAVATVAHAGGYWGGV